MAAEASEAVEPDYVSSKRPSRSIYIFHQALKTLLYVFLVILVFVLAITWTLVITFSIVPIILWKRGYHKVLEYYCAPFELQRDLFRSYRGALKTGKAEWDFEKGRPEPIALLERGFKSHEERIPAPQKSLFLSLPAELRLKIYKELVIGNGSLYCVSVHRSKRPGDKRSTCLIQGHICSQDLQRAPTIDCNCFDLRHHDSCRRLQREVASVVQGVGLSGLSRTCLLTFHFDYLNHPPLFLQSILPQRLALIKHIRICYNQCLMRNLCTPSSERTRRSRHEHRLQQCPRCNFNRWLDIIRRTMTGLERIDVLVYADIDLSPIAVDEPWIGPLFNLQHGANGLRDLKIHVFPVCGGFYARQPGSPHNLQPHARSAQTDQLDTLLQDMIKKGVEEHTPKNCAVEPTTDQEAPEASTV